MDSQISTADLAPGQFFAKDILNRLSNDSNELASVLSGLQDTIAYIIAAIEGNADNI
jgi:hypothetical protein